MNRDRRQPDWLRFALRADAGSKGNALKRAAPGERLRVRSLAALSLTVVLLVAFAALLALPLQAQAQALTTFVTNTVESVTPNSTNSIVAQSFETGANAGEFTISEVQIRIDTASGRRTRVRIRENDSGEPGGLVAILTNPGTLEGGLNTFTAPAGTTLAASTTYWITVSEEMESSRVSFAQTTADGETGETGWRIGNTRLYKASETAAWSTAPSSLLIAIKGTNAFTDATLSDLALEDGDDNAITLSPVFASGTFEYAASVASAVSRVTVTPTTSEADATLDYLDGDDNALTDVDTGTDGRQVDLTAGEMKTIKVRVTAEDTTTTQTYTVQVTRAETCDGVWCATLHVQPLGGGHRGCGNGSPGDRCSNTAHLTEDEFTHASTDYSVTAVRLQSNGQLQLWTDVDIAAGSDSLVLHVGSDTFAFEDADQKDDRSRFWNNSGFSWSNDDAVELKLTESPAFTDATLSDLALEDGDDNAITLSPVFASGTFEYAASVASAVSRVTVTPTTSEADATLDYLDGDDNALTDVETGTDGHQVDLTAGEMKTIKVRVTAEDTTTTQTYTVQVTRAETCDGVWCATLHVQPLGGGHRGCANSSPGDRCSNTAHLTEDEFTHASTDWVVTAVVLQSNGQLRLWTGAHGGASSDSLVLHVGSDTFAFEDADEKDDRSRFWNNSGFSWSNDDAVELKLTESPAFTDATLSDLALEDGDDNAITLSPVFASGTFEYAASVASAVSRVTVTPTTSEADATLDYLDGDDNALTDVETGADGHQVDLTAGEMKTIKVRVTAEDTTTTQTYTVQVTRAETCDGVWCATLHVQPLGGGHRGCANSSPGDRCSNTAHLTEDEFTHASTDWVVTAVVLQSNGQLRLWTGAHGGASSDSLVLHVGSDTFAFEDADEKDDRSRFWNNSGFSWSNDDAVELKLTESPAFTDATLSDLALEDGDDNAITLSPVFASGTFEYAASVANDVEEVTLTATVKDGGATVSAVTLNGTAITDSVFTDGITVSSLLVGDNGIVVTVTAEDGTTTQTYTITMTRAANSDATGAPAITGVPQVGKTLTAGTSAIMDADGLPGSFTYQWVRVDSDGTSNETNIGLNSSTYAPAAADVGKKIKVKVSFTDDAGNPEGPLASDAYPSDGTVLAGAGLCPAGSDWCALLTVEADATLGNGYDDNPSFGNLNDTSIDHGVTTYTVSEIRIQRSSDAGVKILLNAFLPHGVVFNLGGTEFTTDAASETSHTGRYSWTIPTGFAWIDGQMVAVSLKLPAFNSDPAFEDGATASRGFDEDITPGDAFGRPLTATDGDGDWDTLTYRLEGPDAASFAIDASGQLQTKTGVSYDYETKSSYSVTAKADGGAGGTAAIAVTVNVRDVDEPPDAPNAPMVSPTSGSATSLEVSWTEPTNTGRPGITSYDLRYRVGKTRGFMIGPQNEIGTSAAIGRLTPGTSYEVQVRATNAEGDGAWSGSGSGTTTTKSGVSVSKTALTVTEEAATGSSYTVVLDSQPTEDVTVTVAGHSGTDVTPTPTTLTFTTSNWNRGQKVTVKAGKDANTINEMVTLTHSAASTDSNYDGITIDSVTVTVNDREAPNYYVRSILSPPRLGLFEMALPEEEINVWIGPPYSETMYVVAEGDRWAPSGVWGDPAQDTIWVVDPIHFGIHALKLSALKEGRIERHIAADTSEFDYRFNYQCHFNETVASGYGNPALTVMWGDDATIWVVNVASAKLDSYTRNGSRTSGCNTKNVTEWRPDGTAATAVENFKTPFTRDRSKGYSLDRGAGPLTVRGIWSDGTKIWVSGPPGGIYTIDMGTGKVVEAPGFDGHYDTNGLWSDGTTMWVATTGWLRAYHLDTGLRRPAFDVRLNQGRTPGDMWSDGQQIWITYPSGSIEVYRLPTL